MLCQNPHSMASHSPVKAPYQVKHKVHRASGKVPGNRTQRLYTHTNYFTFGWDHLGKGV